MGIVREWWEKDGIDGDRWESEGRKRDLSNSESVQMPILMD